MKTESLIRKTLGEIVAGDIRIAGIFNEAGLDFCCGGNKPLDQACHEKLLDTGEIIQKIREIDKAGPDPAYNFKDWPTALLIDHIVNTHHKYVLKTLPGLVSYTRKIAEVHGRNHPELGKVAFLFGRVSEELLQHLRNEEEVLFPAVKEAIDHQSSRATGIIRREISRMKGEHEFAGGAIDKINEITSGYKVPSDGCNTYKVAFGLLREFEEDLHIHVHLENNILFPDSLKL